jgi:DNA-binding XRE family transcriptional regulator
MSDEEMLRLLGAREQRGFAAVAEETANVMMGDFRVVREDVLDAVREQSEDVQHAVREQSEDTNERVLRELGEVYDELWARLDSLEAAVEALPDQLDSGESMSMEHTLIMLKHAREMGGLACAMRIDRLDDADVDDIERVINAPIDPHSYLQNQRELGAWRRPQEALRDDNGDVARAVRKVVAIQEGGGGSEPPPHPRLPLPPNVLQGLSAVSRVREGVHLSQHRHEAHAQLLGALLDHDPVLAGLLREIREEAGETRETIARAADLTLGTIARVELAESTPSFPTVEAITRALGLSMAELGALLDERR